MNMLRRGEIVENLLYWFIDHCVEEVKTSKFGDLATYWAPSVFFYISRMLKVASHLLWGQTFAEKTVFNEDIWIPI